MPEVGWCNNCNVPILDGRDCGICHNHSIKLRFTKAELKPIFDKEKQLYRNILARNELPSYKLFNATAFHNVMGEVVASGRKVFRLSYDEKIQDWRVKFFKDSLDHVHSLRGSILEHVIEANKWILKEKEQEAATFLEKAIKRYARLPLAVSFSGGKDSTVTLALTRLIERKMDVIFLNTTIEFEETVKYVRDMAKLWDVNLVEVRPPQDFFALCGELGPPSTKMKWCCKTQKFSPQNQLINERYPKGVLVISGIRKNESNIRSRFKRIQRNKMIPRQILAFPILNWSSLDVWLYLLWKNIPYNSMYNYGFARIGCWACPEKSLRDLKLVESIHPELVERLRQTLTSYAEHVGIKNPRIWIRSGKWRFRKTKWEREVVCTSSRLCSMDDQMVYTFADAHGMDRVKEFLRIFGQTTQMRSMTKITSSNIEIAIIGNKMRVSSKNPKIPAIFEKQLRRALNCVGCGACVGICPVGALKIESGEIKVGSECTSCLRCVTSNGLRMSCVSVNYKPHILSVT